MFNTTNALPQDVTWSKFKITKFSGFEKEPSEIWIKIAFSITTMLMKTLK